MRVAAALFLTLLLSAPTAAQRGARGTALFHDPPAPVAPPRSADPTIVRARVVKVDLALLRRARTARLPLTLNFFDDAKLVATRDRVENEHATGFTWIGRVRGAETSEVTLVLREDVVVGNARVLEKQYQVRFLGKGLHVVYEIDASRFPEEGEPLAAEPKKDDAARAPGAEPAPRAAAADSGAYVDVLVVYTPTARAAAGGHTAMEALIDLAWSETNTGYANSGVFQRLRVVHVEEVAYSEAGFDWNLTLARLRGTSDSFMDDVHRLRDCYAADTVMLIVENKDLCGIGYCMTTPTPVFAVNAFTVVSRSCATGNYTFAHELGHNMGSHHDPANSSGPCGSYPYSHGYRHTSFPKFRSIMAYDCGGCTRFNFWSNPNLILLGPAGNAATMDNGHSLNNNAFTVANWRVATDYVEVGGVGWDGQGADTALAKLDSDPRPDVIFMAYDSPPGPNTFRYLVGWNLNTAGIAASWGGGVIVPGVGWEGQGAGATMASLGGGPRPELILMAYDNPAGPNTFRYRVGWDVDAAGNAVSWSNTVIVPGVGWEGQGAGAAVAFVNSNTVPDLIFMAYDNPAGPNTFRYRVGWDVGSNSIASSWSNTVIVPGVGWEGQGAGAAVADFDANGRPDLVLVAYDGATKANDLRGKVGWNLDVYGVASFWSDLDCTKTMGWEGQGAGAVIVDLDGNGVSEMIGMVYDSPPTANSFRYRVVPVP